MNLKLGRLKRGGSALLLSGLVVCHCLPGHGRTLYRCSNRGSDWQGVLLSPRMKLISQKTIKEDEPWFDVAIDLEDGVEVGEVGTGPGFFVFKANKAIHLSRNSHVNDDYFDLSEINMTFTRRSFTRLADDKIFMAHRSGSCILVLPKK